MGLLGGFLGWEAHDERLPGYLQAVDEAGIKITIDIHPIGATHPNTYKLTLKNSKETHTLTALSTGGGMIQVIEIDGAPVLMAGDFYETLIDAHQGLSSADSHAFNARLVLLLANHIGSLAVLREALAAAQASSLPG